MESFKYFYDQLSSIKSVFQENMEDRQCTDLTKYDITEKYFCNINKAADNICDFANNYLISDEFRGILQTIIDNDNDDNVKLCILVDVMRCFDGMDHPTSFTTPEGIALLVLLNKFFGERIIESFEDLQEIDSGTLSLTNLLPYISECSYEIGNRSNLFISTVLEDIDYHLDYNYRLSIFNLCKNIAEVDGIIEQSEKEWLEEIARLDDDDITNDIEVDNI